MITRDILTTFAGGFGLGVVFGLGLGVGVNILLGRLFRR